MDFQGRRCAAAAMVVAVAMWFFMWFRRRVEDAQSITYGPMTERDKQRLNDLRYIYESDDVSHGSMPAIKFDAYLVATKDGCQGIMPWYIVYRGKKPVVYESWAQYNDQVAGYKRNNYKMFPSKEEPVASYLEYMGCEDISVEHEPLVEPPTITRANQSGPKFAALIAIAVFEAFLVIILMFFIATPCCTCK